jgi:DNA-binding NarL/FixJ family response regulator
MNGLQIFLADPSAVCRRGLHSLLLLQSGWSVCGETKNGREAVERSLELKPDIVILDFELTEINGIEATHEIKRELPSTEILFYTMHDEEYIIAKALRAGVRGHVLKSDSEDTLIAAITVLSKHLPFFSTKAVETLVNHLLKKANDSSETGILSEREGEITRLLAEAKTNKEIASHLQISVKTVEAHRSSIMMKLGFKSITELVRYAIRNKFVQP